MYGPTTLRYVATLANALALLANRISTNGAIQHQLPAIPEFSYIHNDVANPVIGGIWSKQSSVADGLAPRAFDASKTTAVPVTAHAVHARCLDNTTGPL